MKLKSSDTFFQSYEKESQLDALWSNITLAIVTYKKRS